MMMVNIMMIGDHDDDDDGNKLATKYHQKLFSHHLPDHPTDSSSCDHNHPKLECCSWH